MGQDGCGFGREGRLKSAAAAIVLALLLLVFAANALAHGERAQEPSLRLSTIQWYDTKWSSDQIGVNQELTLSGRFHVMASWPLEIPSPAGLAFLNVGVPGPVFIRTASVVNGVNGASSMSLGLGQDYEYRIILKGRIPGRYHVHPMLDVRDTGPILGPGKWVSVTGDAAAFVDPVTTLTGRRLDLARYGLGAIAGWHLVWAAIALLWLGYWIRKPLLMPRYEAVQAGNGDRLITRTDRITAAVVLALTLIVAIGETVVTNFANPVTVPLQSNQTKVPALAPLPAQVTLVPEQVNYLVPGRTVQFRLRVTNMSVKPIRFGEFTTANLRFLNQAVVKAESDYPQDLIAPAGLVVRPEEPILPGVSEEVYIEATSPVWETDRLTALTSDPTNRIGGLFMFYAPDGERSLAEFSSPIVPTFIQPVWDAK
ncbi:MAG: methane monooxygenase/ammonia monooxygenase subunit B [Deltaproteobacteria bacterium]|nr:methane monooxygenase/ammonia monooxygenase subunit B [Deltaproteobacteria bacterium]